MAEPYAAGTRHTGAGSQGGEHKVWDVILYSLYMDALIRRAAVAL
jgi:hypothetical protein